MKKRAHKKLSVSKETITNLNADTVDMKQVRGGGTDGQICVVTSLPPQFCVPTAGTMCTRNSCTFTHEVFCG